jgi:hypothetical protein
VQVYSGEVREYVEEEQEESTKGLSETVDKD